MATTVDVSAEIRTNVRFSNWSARLREKTLRLASSASPGLGARWAIRRFCTPSRPPATAPEETALATATPLAIRAGGQRLAAFAWGEGPAVLLVHGWSGRGSQLAAFVPGLVAAGYSAVAFDAPAHGASAGRRATLLDFRDAVRAVAERLGRPHAILAHSLGAAATVLAWRDGLEVARAALLAPPADPRAYLRRFVAGLGLPGTVAAAAEARLQARTGVRWQDLVVPAAARSLAGSLLVVHDRLDREVPWEDGAAIAAAWPGARLLTTAGLGHRRLLRDPAVVARVVAFLTADGATARPAVAPPARLAFAPADPLERELFDREARRERVGAGRDA
jgi:predicted alpha/beta hydrolase family esterase